MAEYHVGCGVFGIYAGTLNFPNCWKEEQAMYKPLTPTFRRQIIDAIDGKITELRECEGNAFVNAQLIGWDAQKTIINALPDGYPIPLEGGTGEND